MARLPALRGNTNAPSTPAAAPIALGGGRRWMELSTIAVGAGQPATPRNPGPAAVRSTAKNEEIPRNSHVRRPNEPLRHPRNQDHGFPGVAGWAKNGISFQSSSIDRDIVDEFVDRRISAVRVVASQCIATPIAWRRGRRRQPPPWPPPHTTGSSPVGAHAAWPDAGAPSPSRRSDRHGRRGSRRGRPAARPPRPCARHRP